jgi:hypothetical protein
MKRPKAKTPKPNPLDCYDLDLIGSFLYRYSDFFEDHCKRMNRYTTAETHELIMRVSAITADKA